MARGSRTKTIAEQAISEIKRIERMARRVEKRGYRFNLPYGKTRTGKQKTRWTRSELEYLKTIRTKDIYKYGTAYGMSAEEYRREERKQAAYKAQVTIGRKRMQKEAVERERLLREIHAETVQEAAISDTMIENFLSNVGWYRYSKKLFEEIKLYIYELVARYGADHVASVLEKARAGGFFEEMNQGYMTAFQMQSSLDKYLEGYLGDVGLDIDMKFGQRLDEETIEWAKEEYGEDDEYEEFFN